MRFWRKKQSARPVCGRAFPPHPALLRALRDDGKRKLCAGAQLAVRLELALGGAQPRLRQGLPGLVVADLGLLLGDILMAIVDPRISFTKKEGSR